MAQQPVITRPLAAFLGLVALVLIVAGVLRLVPHSLPEAVDGLAAADIEGRERLVLLEQVRAGMTGDLAAAEGDTRLLGAMAAVGLQDEVLWQRVLAGATLPLDPDSGVIRDADRRKRAALGDPLLAALLEAMILEVTGEVAKAHDRYTKVERSSVLFFNDFARRLAAQGRLRTG